VDQDRHAQLTRPGPQRVQPGIIHGNEPPICVSMAQAQFLKKVSDNLTLCRLNN
jgi:hypothetical protein